MSTISSKSCNSFALDSVNVSSLGDNSTLPLVISPRWDSTLKFLCSFMETNRKWLEQMMVAHGAILIRGFDIEDGRDFERAVQSYQPVLNSTYKGTSPRNIIPNTSHVFSAAEVPVNYPIGKYLLKESENQSNQLMLFPVQCNAYTSQHNTSKCLFSMLRLENFILGVYKSLSLREVKHHFVASKKYIATFQAISSKNYSIKS